MCSPEKTTDGEWIVAMQELKVNHPENYAKFVQSLRDNNHRKELRLLGEAQ